MGGLDGEQEFEAAAEDAFRIESGGFGWGVLQAEILPDATLKIYEDYSHGMLTVNADVLNADILAFIQS